MYHDKKRYLKAFIVLCSWVMLSFNVNGQKVQVSMEGPSAVNANERFQLNVTVNANPTAFTPPNLNDFHVLMGPNRSFSNESVFSNGRMEEQTQVTFSYILQPSKTGKITIPPAAFTVNGKKYSSNSLTIDVSGKASAGQSSQSNQQTAPTSSQSFDESGDLFLRISLDKTNVYQGEFITGTIKLYTRLDVERLTDFKLPSFNGFYHQNIEIPQLRPSREIVNGKSYTAAVLNKFILIPQKAGDLVVSPGSVQCLVVVSSGFFGNDLAPQVVKSKPVKVTVKPLPDRPASFTGAVGKFNMSVAYDKTKVKADDPVILKVNIFGAGNIKLMEAPKINFPEDIETSEPSSTNKINDKDGGISGSRQFEYLLIPRAPGKATLPPIEFSYFDPISKQYKTLTSPATTLDVAPSAGGTATTGTAVSKEDLRFLGKDIEYIKLHDIKLKRSGSRLYGSVVFYAGYLLPLLVFAFILLWRRNYIRQNANMALTRNRKAQKYAGKRMKKAKEYLAQSKKESFYEEVLKALWGYLSDKLSIPVSELSRENAREQLLERGVDDESINRIMTLLDTCEFARYAPASSDNTMQSDYKEAISIITQIQERIR